MSLTVWLVILSIIFLSGIVKGTTGFGFALFSLPLLAHFIPIKTLIPVLTLFNLFSSSQIVLQSHQLRIKKSIVLLSVTGIAGIVCGSIMLKFMPDKWLKLLASVVLIILSAMFLTGYRFKIRKLKRGNAIAGIVSGFLGGSLAVSGPPLALFLTSLKLDTENFRNTFAWFSIVTASVATADYIKIGIVHLVTFKIFFISLPGLILSIWLGNVISRKIPVKIFYTGVVTISLMAGILLFLSCLRECLIL
jgi:uncharacterized membrane protein YfcA